MQISFVSKDSNWQQYRSDILKKLCAEYKVEVTVHTTGKLQPYIVDDTYVKYHIHRSWLPLTYKPSFFPGALWSIWRTRPDVVLGMMNLSQFTESAALLLCWLTGIRFVWWTHAYDHSPSANPFIRRLREKSTLFLLRRADSIITYSPTGKQYLLGHGFPDAKVVYAPNTLDTDQLLASVLVGEKQEKRTKVAQMLGVRPGTRFVLFSGRLQARKRADEAIRALRTVITVVPDIHFLLIGDGPERRPLEALAHQLIPGHYTFLGPIYDDAQLTDFFAAAELFIMPGWVGLAIVHAFAFGLPLITTQGPHPPEIQYLHDGHNGFMTPQSDIDAMAGKICQMLQDAALLDAMSRSARHTVETEANVHLMLQALAAALGIENAETSSVQS